MTVQTQQDTTKYFIYVRKSTDDEERQQLSIPSQLDELKTFAKKNNLEVVDSLVELKSAKAPGRKVFNSLIERILIGEASGILSWHADRLARNAVDAGMIIHLLDTGKLVDLKFPTVQFQNNPQGKFMLSIAFGTSKYYVDNLAINTKRGLVSKAKSGMFPGIAPFGYQNDKLKKVIVVDKEAAPVAREVFELYATGQYNYKKIGLWLAEKGFKSKSMKGCPGGKPFRPEKIKYMLSNPFYYGVFKYGGEFYQGKYKPIISKKLFDQVQIVMEKRVGGGQKLQKRGYKQFVFSNLIRCSECGYQVTKTEKVRHYKNGQSQVFCYYHCTKASKKTKCGQPYIRKNQAIEDLLQICQKVSLQKRAGNWLLARLSEDEQKKVTELNQVNNKLNRQLKENKLKLERLLSIYLDNQVSREEYVGQKNQFLGQKKTIEDNLINLIEYQHDRVKQAKDFVRLAMEARTKLKKNKKSQKKLATQLDEMRENSKNDSSGKLVQELAGDSNEVELYGEGDSSVGLVQEPANRLDGVEFGDKVGSQMKLVEESSSQLDRIEPRLRVGFPQEFEENDPLILKMAEWLGKAELNLILKEQKVYHIKQNPWAALCAAATNRNWVGLLDFIRTHFNIQ